eukprot:758889-Hanusia_phi.AAC.4
MVFAPGHEEPLGRMRRQPVDLPRAVALQQQLGSSGLDVDLEQLDRPHQPAHRPDLRAVHPRRLRAHVELHERLQRQRPHLHHPVLPAAAQAVATDPEREDGPVVSVDDRVDVAALPARAEHLLLVSLRELSLLAPQQPPGDRPELDVSDAHAHEAVVARVERDAEDPVHMPRRRRALLPRLPVPHRDAVVDVHPDGGEERAVGVEAHGADPEVQRLPPDLPSSRGDEVRVQGQADDVIGVAVEELLRVLDRVVHHSRRPRQEHDVSVPRVLRAVPRVVHASPVDELHLQPSQRRLVRVLRFPVLGRGHCHGLRLEDEQRFPGYGKAILIDLPLVLARSRARASVVPELPLPLQVGVVRLRHLLDPFLQVRELLRKTRLFRRHARLRGLLLVLPCSLLLLVLARQAPSHGILPPLLDLLQRDVLARVHDRHSLRLEPRQPLVDPRLLVHVLPPVYRHVHVLQRLQRL